MPIVRTNLQLKEDIAKAGRTAVQELVKIAESPILNGKNSEEFLGDVMNGDELAADKMKNAAAAKKLAIFDALDILERVEQVEQDIKEIKDNERGAVTDKSTDISPERRARNK